MSYGSDWDFRYDTSYRSNGPHHFNVGDRVRRNNVILGGTVEKRTALYAIIRWDNGVREEIQQLDRTVTS